MFEVGKAYKTIDGRRAEILSLTSLGNFRVRVYTMDDLNIAGHWYYTSEGKFARSEGYLNDAPLDLVPEEIKYRKYK